MSDERAEQGAGQEPEVNVNSQLAKLFQSGVLVSIHVSRIYWKQTLEPQDYGLDKFPDNWSGGHRELLEGELVEKIASLEGAARTWLDKVSLDFPIRLVRFIPRGQVESVLTELNRRAEEYQMAVETLISRYDELKAQMQEKYPAQWPFMVGHYPSVETIRRRHTMSHTMFEMAFPKMMDGLDLSVHAGRQQALTEHQQALQRMYQQQADQTRRTMSTFIETTVRDLRGTAIKRFTEVLDIRKNGGKVTARTVNSLKGVIDRVRSLDFLDDRTFREQMDGIARQLDSTDNIGENQDAMAQLDNLLRGAIHTAGASMEGTIQAAQDKYFKRKLTL